MHWEYSFNTAREALLLLNALLGRGDRPIRVANCITTGYSPDVVGPLWAGEQAQDPLLGGFAAQRIRITGREDTDGRSPHEL